MFIAILKKKKSRLWKCPYQEGSGPHPNVNFL